MAVSAWDSMKAWRVLRAWTGSWQKRLLHCGSATWTVRCMRSPEKTASPAGVVRRTATWPGVWPGVGSKRRPGAISCRASTSAAPPASTIGVTLSAMQPEASRPSAASHVQNSHSSPGMT